MKFQAAIKASLQENKRFLVAVFCMALLASSFVSYIHLNWRYMEERNRIKVLADAQMVRLDLAARDMIHDMKVVQLLLVRQSGGTAHFAELADQAMSENTVLQGIGLAPQGVMSSGARGNLPPELAAGSNLLASGNEFQAAAQWARAYGNPVSVRISSGAEVLLYPIYLSGSETSFWGFAVAQISLEQLLNKMDQQQTGQIAYALYQLDPWETTERLVARSPEELLARPQEKIKEIGVQSQMKLLVTPASRWLTPFVIGSDLFLSLLFSLLVVFVAAVFHKIRQQKKSFQRLASEDSLTGVYNRRKFIEVLQKACQVQKPFLLCYMDFDRFKEVNDTYGHDVGDELLQAGAKRLVSCIRREDMLFRIGGDEFVAYIRDPGTEESRAARVDMLNARMQEPFHFDAVVLYMRISVGYVLYPRDAKSSEELVRMADHRMYVEKQRHKED